MVLTCDTLRIQSLRALPTKGIALFHIIMLVIMVVLASSNLCIAQNESMKFENISILNGLSNNRVKNICQDSRGFLWFGTKEGLSIYDGYTFTNYYLNINDSNSLPNNIINSLTEDISGKGLWIGTNNGISYYDFNLKRFHNYWQKSTNHPNPFLNQVKSVVQSSSGDLWLGTYRGLKRAVIDRESGVKIQMVDLHRSPLSSRGINISHLFEDSKNTLWISYHSGELGRYYPKKDENYVVCKDFKWGMVLKIIELQNGRLWLFTRNDGIVEYQPDSHRFSLLKIDGFPSKNIINTAYQDNQGGVWIGTNKGLFHITLAPRPGNVQQYKYTHYYNNPGNTNSLTENHILSILKDASGVVWAGTRDNGICKITHEAQYFSYYNPTFPKGKKDFLNGINTISEDSRKRLWICSTQGLCRYNRTTKTYTFFEKELSELLKSKYKNIFSICEDKLGNIWAGCYDVGLIRITPGDNFSLFTVNNSNLASNTATSIKTGNDGSLLIGFYKGHVQKIRVDDLDSNTPLFRHFKPLNDHTIPSYIYSRKQVLEDHNGDLWITTTSEGLYHFDVTSKKMIHYLHDASDPSSIPSNHITSIYQLNKENIALGTTHGLVLFNRKTRKFKQYSMQEGLPDNSIVSVLNDDQDNIWILTPNWISRLNLATGNIRNFQFYHRTHNQLFTHEPMCKTSDGKIFVGTQANGFFSFNPDSIKQNNYMPPVVLTELKISGNPIELNKQGIYDDSAKQVKTLRLNHNQHNLTFEFSALSYYHQEKNRYACLLEGGDNEWQYLNSNQRSVNYFNIPPGTYTFKVKAANCDGVWNDNPTTLKIHVRPPWWKTWWAYCLYGLTIIVILIGLSWYTYSWLKLKNSLQFEQLEKEKIKELNDEKLRFFTNISHDFRTPLTLIHGPLERLLSLKDTSVNVRQHYNLMHENVKRLLRLINQLMDFQKIEDKKMVLAAEHVDLVPFTKNIINLFTDNASQRDIILDFRCDVDELLVWIDKDKIDKAVFNLLSNALKFTHKGGVITVTISIPDDHDQIVRISVKDTGIGIGTEHLSSIFDRFYRAEHKHTGTGIGLSLVKSYIELHKGTIEVESTLGKGTDFIIHLPLGKDHLSSKELKSAVLEVKPNNLQQKSNESLKDKESNMPETTGDLPTVMVVEDNPEIRKFIRDILIDDYQIVEADHGKMATQLLKTNAPDLIISDIMMPEMDGLELLKHVRSDIEISHIPVILLTALDTVEDKLSGYKTGADDYISKPFNPEILITRVENLIQSRQALKYRFKNELSIGPKEITIASADEKLLEKATRYIEDNIDDPKLTVEKLGEEIGISRVHLYRKIKALTDLTATEFIRTIKLKYAARILLEKNLNVSEVAYAVGFTNPVSFSKAFRKQFGVSPTDYRKK